MTTTAHEDQFTPAPVEVTQADREAAAKHLGYSDPYSELLATEQAEIDELAAILAHFARHRIAHSAPAGEVEARTIYVQWAPNGTIRKWDWDEFELAERLKVETAPVSDKPIAWMYTYHPKPPETRPGAVEFKRDRTKLPLDKRWSETPLYTHPAPPADLVEALVVEIGELAIMELDIDDDDPKLANFGKRLRAALAKHGGA